MTGNPPAQYEDTPPYDKSLITAATAMPVVIMTPIFLLLAYSEPELTPIALILLFLVPLVVVMFPYSFGVPARVVVTEKGIAVRHGKLLRIEIPASSLVSIELKPPPWWFNIYYLFANAQWVYVRKSTGLLKWWSIPATSAARLKVILDSLSTAQ